MVTFIDGPFISDPSLPASKQKEWLREQVYNTMVLRSAENEVQMVKYVRREDT